MLMISLEFLALAAVVALAGTYLARSADQIPIPSKKNPGRRGTVRIAMPERAVSAMLNVAESACAAASRESIFPPER